VKTGITGGIGSGKSYVCKLLARRGIEVYDCDAAAKRLMRTSPELRRQLTELIGPETYISQQSHDAHLAHNAHLAQAPHETHDFQPTLNKAVVARFLLASEENARAIDAIVHPAVFRDFEESGLEWIESAILFESGARQLVDRVVVVTAPEEVRVQRIMARDGISREKALEWIARQWPQQKVRQMADFEIVNDGLTDIEPQIDTLLHHDRRSL
jgi:dephospho-CoA kinase